MPPQRACNKFVISKAGIMPPVCCTLLGAGNRVENENGFSSR